MIIWTVSIVVQIKNSGLIFFYNSFICLSSKASILFISSFFKVHVYVFTSIERQKKDHYMQSDFCRCRYNMVSECLSVTFTATLQSANMTSNHTVDSLKSRSYPSPHILIFSANTDCYIWCYILILVFFIFNFLFFLCFLNFISRICSSFAFATV